MTPRPAWANVVGNHLPLIQIATIEDLVKGDRRKIPLVLPPYTEARPVKDLFEEQMRFDL